MLPIESRRAAEAGFSLAALITFLTVISMFAAVAVPVYTTQTQRELEEELIFRGEEYVRAIQKYQRQFGVYPPDLDALLESNEMRFLRREYLDPITGEGFRLIKANPDGTLEGSRIYEYEDLPLFSGPLGSTALGAGASSGSAGAPGGGLGESPFATGGGFGGLGNGGGQTGGPALPGLGQPSGSGQPQGAGLGGFGGLSQLNGGGIPGFGQPSGGGEGPSANGSGGRSQPQGGFSGFGQQAGGRGGGDARQLRRGQGDGTGEGPRSGGGSLRGTLAGSLIGGGQGTGAPGPGPGGAGDTAQAAAISGIVGVAPNNEASSLKVYNERDIYAEWEFIALPTAVAVTGQTPGLMPGDENNSGQPSTFQSTGSPFGNSANPFRQ